MPFQMNQHTSFEQPGGSNEGHSGQNPLLGKSEVAGGTFVLAPCEGLDPSVDDLHPLLVRLDHLLHPLGGEIKIVLLCFVRTSSQNVFVRDLRIKAVVGCNFLHLSENQL